MKEAVKLNSTAIYYAADSIKLNRDFVYDAVKSNPSIYNYFLATYPNDEPMIIEAVRENPEIINALNPLWKNNRNVAIALVKQNAINLEMVSGKFGYDKKVIREFFSSNYTEELVKRLMCPQVVDMYYDYIDKNSSNANFGNYLDSIWLKSKIEKISEERMKENASEKIKNSIKNAQKKEKTISEKPNINNSTSTISKTRTTVRGKI